MAGAMLILAQSSIGAQAGVSDAPSYAESRKLSEQGKFDEAIAALNEISTAHPDAKNLAHEFGLAYYRKGDFVAAVTSLQKAIAENPADNEATQLLGLSLYLGNKPAEAIPYLEKVQTWYSSANVDAAYILGICYTRTKAYPQARQAFARMFGVGPDSAASYLFAARMFLRQDVAEVANEYAQRAVALDGKLPLAHQLLGEIYLYQSKLPEAVGQFQKELEINPGFAAGYYKLADAYSRMQKYDDAEKLLQRSIWLDATATGPYILLGKVLEKKGETELAVRALQRAISMDPNNAIAHHLLGESYRDLGRSEDAEHELKLAETLQSRQNDKP